MGKLTLAKFEKLKNNRTVIILEIVFLLALAALGIYTCVFSRAVVFDASKYVVWSKEQGMECKIEGIETSEDAGKYYLEIKGWVIERTIESKASDTIRVVLKDADTGKYYYLPTRRASKASITRQFYDGTKYDDCGFEAKVRLGKELSGNASEYEVFIFVSNGNGTKLVKTDVGVVSWLTGR